MRKQVLSLMLAGALLVGATPVIANAQGQWSSENGKWYYNDNGTWTKGWMQIGGQWYYFNANSEMHTGWLDQGGKWYYMNSNGQMVTGTYSIDGKTHNFNSNGQWMGEVKSPSNNNISNNQATANVVDLKVGQTIKMQDNNGEWEFAIEGTRVTTERNSYSEKKPKKVIFFDYNYKNISYNRDLIVFEGLQFKLMDEEGNILNTYPVSDYARMPKAIPAGAKCKATQALGLETDSKKITVVLYSGYNKIAAKGVIDIQ